MQNEKETILHKNRLRKDYFIFALKVGFLNYFLKYEKKSKDK